jgi:hypothetical protein
MRKSWRKASSPRRPILVGLWAAASRFTGGSRWGEDFRDWISPDVYLDLARALDRACFDYVMIEDGSLIPNAYGCSMDAYLRHAVNAPKADPTPLVPLMAHATKGLV